MRDIWDEGACKGKPVEWWFSDDEEDISRARDLCYQCTVRQECLNYALSIEGADEEPLCYGIYGGWLPEERQAKLKKTFQTDTVNRVLALLNQ